MFKLKDEEKNDLTKLLLDAAGYRKSQIVLTAINLDIFTTIQNSGEGDLESLSKELCLRPRNLEGFLGGLVALNLLSFDGHQYTNSRTARNYLVKSSPYYLGEGIAALYDIGQETWGSLNNSIRQGRPVASQRTDKEEAEFWPKLTRSIKPFNIPVAESTANLLLWKKDKIRKVLDLGGGSGVFGGAFLKAFPKATVTQVDWPSVNEVAIKHNAVEYKEKRFKTINGSIFESSWEKEGPFDVVVISHIVHQEDMASCKSLLKKVGNALSEDGEVIINEFVVNETKDYPPYGLIFGLSMTLQNNGGGVYSFSDCNEMLSVIDHEIYLASSPVPPATLYYSRKKTKDTKKKILTKNEKVTKVRSLSRRSSKDFLPSSFLEREWDTLPGDVRETLLMEQFKNQLQYAQKNSVFWSKKLKGFDFTKKFNRESIESLPILLKSQLRIIDPLELTSKETKSFHIVRGSGGTTGDPTVLLWTKNDWFGAIETSARVLNEIRSWKGMRIWNGYNQAHVAGPAFDDIIRMVGATPIPRHFKATDEEALREMELLKANALVLTPKSGSGKGGSLEDFLSIDPNFIERLGIKHLWVSSTPLDKELISELKSLGVVDIVNFYGSTESMPNAISCPSDPQSFHICNGHVFLEVVDENGKHVDSGERGALVVSRIGSTTGTEIQTAKGTQVFRFLIGDSAIFTKEACECGLTTPRIYNVERLELDEETVVGGCERWD